MSEWRARLQRDAARREGWASWRTADLVRTVHRAVRRETFDREGTRDAQLVSAFLRLVVERLLFRMAGDLASISSLLVPSRPGETRRNVSGHMKLPFIGELLDVAQVKSSTVEECDCEETAPLRARL